jgi:sigma-E factor negative regulatory protein RseC
MAEKSISHEGVIEETDSKEIRVKITDIAPCGDCQAREACPASHGDEKILTVPMIDSGYRAGEKVRVTIAQSLGFRALFLGYGLPLILVLTVMLVMTGISDNELTTGLVSLTILLPYYVALRLLRGRIDRQFLIKLSRP